MKKEILMKVISYKELKYYKNCFFFVLGHNLFRPLEKFVREREKKFFETEILLKG